MIQGKSFLKVSFNMFFIHYLRACPFIEMKVHNPKTICKFPRGSFSPNIVIRVIDTYKKLTRNMTILIEIRNERYNGVVSDFK